MVRSLVIRKVKRYKSFIFQMSHEIVYMSASYFDGYRIGVPEVPMKVHFLKFSFSNCFLSFKFSAGKVFINAIS